MRAGGQVPEAGYFYDNATSRPEPDYPASDGASMPLFLSSQSGLSLRDQR
jgi:hypothetical protein